MYWILFTWLKGKYRFNVYETTTFLCPRELSAIRVNSSTYADRMRSLLGDLAIVYCHAVLPFDYTRSLPDIDDRWGGFLDQDIPDVEDIIKKRNKYILSDRGVLFREFIRAIDEDSKESLNFFHLILPHTPWEYLPSGKKYWTHRWLEGLTIKKDRWLGPQKLVDQYHQRHRLQVSYTDRLVGELMQHLKDVGLFDDSLIIITADHGCSFHSEDTKRLISKENLAGILFVPLLIKLPGQKNAVVSDTAAEIADIMPTMADVLESDLPWQATGKSLLKVHPTDVHEKRIMGNHWKAYRFSTAELLSAKKKAHKRIVKLFSLDDKQSSPFRYGKYDTLFGKPLEHLKIIDDDIIFEVHQRELFREVDMNGDFVPASVTGRVLSSDKVQKGQSLAISLNNRIQGIACTYQLNEALLFSGILDESGFRQGANDIELYVIEENPGGSYRLKGRRIGDTKKDLHDSPLVFKKEAGSLVDHDGMHYQIIKSGIIRGKVERLKRREGFSVLYGWAADIEKRAPTDYIAVFHDSDMIYQGHYNARKTHVATALKTSPDMLYGFQIPLRTKTLSHFKNVPLFFALSKRLKMATPLKIDKKVISKMNGIAGRSHLTRTKYHSIKSKTAVDIKAIEHLKVYRPDMNFDEPDEELSKILNELKTAKMHRYEIDLPKGDIQGLQITPSNYPCLVLFDSLEIVTDKSEFNVPVKKPERLKMKHIAYAKNFKPGGLYINNTLPLGYFRIAKLPDMGFKKDMNARLRMKIAVSDGEFIRVYWNLGSGFSEKQKSKIRIHPVDK